MKKANKEMLKTIISNQELIMKALKIEVPVKKVEVTSTGPTTNASTSSASRNPTGSANKASTSSANKKPVKKRTTK